MKKIFATLLAVALLLFFSASAFAQELSISGEAKTGIFWQKTEQTGIAPKLEDEVVKLHNKDDAGGGQGRFRLNLDYDNGNGFGLRVRFQFQEWGNEKMDLPEYFFGYGNFFDEQLTISVGRLGGSPWSTGGPEMWKELETSKVGGGMRVEWKPNFIPVGKLNLGFVLNYFNSDMDQGRDERIPASLANLLRESVIGVSYTHDWFLFRMAYRFDDVMDAIQDNKLYTKGEDELIYRIEENVLKNYIPNFKVWALGSFFGIGSYKYNPDITFFRNWLFVEYSPDMFTAQIRFGLDNVPTRTEFNVKPSFYWHFFNKLLSVGASFWYQQDFGKKLHEGSPYQFIEVEPKLQVNFSSSYVAFAYNFRREYVHDYPEARGKDPIKQTQWMNLRFCIYY